MSRAAERHQAQTAEEAQTSREIERDQEKAVYRGQRLLALTDSILDALANNGHYCQDAKVDLFHVLANDIYGNAAIDVPPLRKAGG